MAADAGPAASSASSRARTGSRETAAASASSITVTSSMAPPSHRKLFLSRRFEFSVGAGSVRHETERVGVPADHGALHTRVRPHALPLRRRRADTLSGRRQDLVVRLGALPLG